MTLPEKSDGDKFHPEEYNEIRNLIQEGSVEGFFRVKGYAEASLPSAGTAGRVARLTDSHKGLVIDTGTRWIPVRDAVNVLDHGAVPDASTDSTSAFQAAHDALPSTGGFIIVPRAASAYMATGVNVSTAHVTVVVDPGATIKALADNNGNGIFQIKGVQPAHFRLTGGGTIDLNQSAYSGLEGVRAVFGLRSTYLTVDDVLMQNAGENFILFRNCARTTVRNCTMLTARNNGVEHNFTSAATDGYSGDASVPTLEWYTVADNLIHGVDDGALGTGDASGTSWGANNTLSSTTIRHVRVRGNNFSECQRAVHTETSGASTWFQDVLIEGNVVEGSLYGGIAVASVLDATVRGNVVRNSGSAAFISGATDTYGILVTESASSVTRNVLVEGNVVVDDRASATAYTKYGIGVNAAQTVSIRGNNVRAGGTAAIRFANVDDAIHVSGNLLISVATPSGAVSIQDAGSSTGTKTLGPNHLHGFAATTGADLMISATARGVLMDTASSADTKTLALSGGGAHDEARGAVIELNGANAAANAGYMTLRAGNVAGAQARVITAGSTTAEFMHGGTVKASRGDLFVADATKGLVLKDSQGTPHYWRITIDNSGSLVITDTGTTAPS